MSLEQTSFSSKDMGELRESVFGSNKFEALRRRARLGNSTIEKNESFVQIAQDSVFEFVLGIALCHNVTPVDEDGQRLLQSSSPDESALVRTVEELGIVLASRTQVRVELVLRDDLRLEFEILHVFPFSSETKRMGIVVREQLTQRVTFYLKGADSVVGAFLRSEAQSAFVEEECSDLAREGLRTLVFASRRLTADEYARWAERLHEADQLLVEREEHRRAVIGELESGLGLLGITGVEDRLQENVQQTLDNLRHAGIKVWMLTGDKMETALCIAISSGLRSPQEDAFLIHDARDLASVADAQHDLRHGSVDLVVIDAQNGPSYQSRRSEIRVSLARAVRATHDLRVLAAVHENLV